MLYPLFSTVIIYYLTGLNPDIRAFVLFNVIIVLHCLTAHSIGLFLSALFMNDRRAQLAGQLWVIFSLLVCGYLLDPGNFPTSIRFFQDLSFIRVSFARYFQTLLADLFSVKPTNPISICGLSTCSVYL